MNQIIASFSRTIKEFLRERAVLFWTIAWPMIWVIISSLSFSGSLPPEVVPYFRGSVTISMMVLALMMAGMANLPASVAADRENGMLTKLMSMPISPGRDFAGRILALGAFAALAAGLVTAVGFAVGARFFGNGTEVAQAIGFLILALSAAAGIGLIIGTLIKRVQGAVMSGVGISVITAAVSGLFAPYELLPPALQQFARVYPISSATNLAKYFLTGVEFVGYNPLTAGSPGLTIGLTLLLLVLGINLYSRFSWRSE